jgi:oligopeptide transport system substrate-binding protein
MKELNNVLPDVTLQLNSGGSRNEEVAQAIQSQLSENLGVKVKLQLVEWAQHTAMIDEGKAKFFRLGWIADYPDPQNFLNLLYGKNIPASGPSSINSTRYSNPEVDTLYDQAIAETDRTKINALWARAESLAMYDAPMLVLYYDEDYHTLQPNVRDFPANAMNRIPLKATWFSD